MFVLNCCLKYNLMVTKQNDLACNESTHICGVTFPKKAKEPLS